MKRSALFRILMLQSFFSLESQPQNPELRNNPETFTHVRMGVEERFRRWCALNL